MADDNTSQHANIASIVGGNGDLQSGTAALTSPTHDVSFINARRYQGNAFRERAQGWTATSRLQVITMLLLQVITTASMAPLAT